MLVNIYSLNSNFHLLITLFQALHWEVFFVHCFTSPEHPFKILVLSSHYRDKETKAELNYAVQSHNDWHCELTKLSDSSNLRDDLQ